MDLTLKLDPASTLPLYRQLSEALRKGILERQLLPGQRLPSSRRLAQILAVSRNTVTQCYDQLLSEGYLQAIPGSGTYVSKEVLTKSTTQQPLRPNWLSAYGASLTDAEPFEPQVADVEISFRYNQPDLSVFPLQLWRKLWARHWRLGHPMILAYAPDAKGYQGLREAVAGYLGRARAVQCTADQVIIVSGQMQALDLVSRVLINRGDGVALENPSFIDSRRLFLAQGAVLSPIAVDEAGLVVDQLPMAGSLKCVLVTPSHQFPTGAVLSLARRLELLAWANTTQALIIEEDYDNEYRYCGRPIPALQGLDRHGCVLYVGGFTQTLFPALRMAYLVVPPALVHVFVRAKWLADRQSPLLEQYMLADFINEGHLERHIRRMRAHYDLRRQYLVAALHTDLGERVTILGEAAGMHMMIRLKTTWTDAELEARAARVGVGLTSCASFYLGGASQGEFVLGFTDLSPEKIKEGIARLGEIL